MQKIQEFKTKLDVLAAEYGVRLVVEPQFNIHVVPAVPGRPVVMPVKGYV